MDETLNNRDILPKKTKKTDTSINSNPFKIIDQYRMEERIDTLLEQLPIWKKIDKWSIKFEFPSLDMKKSLMVFDLSSREILFWWEKINLSLPRDASIKSLEFTYKWIIIEWKFWIFTWKWEASYKWLISAIDEVLKNWRSEIKSDSWLITLAKY